MQRFKPTPKFERLADTETHSLEEWPTQYKGGAATSMSAMPREMDYNDPPPKTLARKAHTWAKSISGLWSLLIGVCWLAPILYLLIVNIQGQVIGAAAWCPGGDCNVISYQEASITLTAALSQHYDEDNHNLIGGLQFVAKALEVWFMYIATTLVWYITVLLAKRPGGLPIGYLLTHLEFGDVRALIDPILYRAAGRSNKLKTGGRRHTTNLYIFAATAIFMCILTNLMGPSVAVLLIPTLHWQNNPAAPNGQFDTLLSSSAPSGDTAIPGCTSADLDAQNYTCTINAYGASLDALVKTAVSEIEQNLVTPANTGDEQVYVPENTGVTLEQAIPFSFNISLPKDGNQNSQDIFWSYSRQLMRGMSADFEDLYAVVLGNTTNQTKLDRYGPYNSSLEMVLQRQGPVVGMEFFTSWGNRTVTEVADDKMIRCFEGFSLTGKTKCLRTGTGWNSSDNFASFFIDQAQAVSSEINVFAYWSDKATYIEPGDACFPNGTLPAGSDCDYDSLFSDVQPDDPTDRMEDIFALEYNVATSNVSNHTVVSQAFMSYGFATYSIDVTSIFPSMQAAKVADPPDVSEMYPMVLHPAWVLAAWSTNQSGDPGPYGDAAFILQNSMVELTTAKQDEADQVNNLTELLRLLWTSYYTMLQAASMVPYSLTPADSLTSTAADPQAQPVLWDNLYTSVWGWGLDSRTSKLGIVVAVLGCVAVVVRTALIVVTREPERSSLELITTALEHQNQGDFDGAQSETEMARVRYQLLADDGDSERFQLMKVR